MLKELINAVESGTPFTEEQQKEYQKLSKKEKEAISKAFQNKTKNENNEEICHEFRRVFLKLAHSNPEKANKEYEKVLKAHPEAVALYEAKLDFVNSCAKNVKKKRNAIKRGLGDKDLLREDYEEALEEYDLAMEELNEDVIGKAKYKAIKEQEKLDTAKFLIKTLYATEGKGEKKNLKIDDLDLSDESILDKYFNDKSYSLNEVMITVAKDDETPEEIKKLVKERLYEKNIGLIIKPLKIYSAPSDGKMSMEDLAQECRMAFFEKAINKYSPSKGVKFSTFATLVIKNHLSSLHTNKVNKLRQEVSFDDPITDDDGTAKTRIDYQVDPNPNGADLVRKESENQILYEALNELNLEQKFVAYCRYGLGGVPKKTQAEIADYMHMSQANVSKIEGTMRVKLKQALDRAGMF